MKREITEVDKRRASYYQFYTGQKWGSSACYDLCVNTTKANIKEWVQVLAKLF